MVSPWNQGASWTYPAIPSTAVDVPANTVKRIKVGPIPWNLPRSSYRWPNRPFREDYVATLHFLNLSLKQGGQTLDTIVNRFGFVEVTQGRIQFSINGVPVTYYSDGTAEDGMSNIDCYSTAPAFPPPSGQYKGCPESFRRFMRLGLSIIRLHNSGNATEYMMNTADEIGFMFHPESPIRWMNLTDPAYMKPYYTRAVKGLANNASPRRVVLCRRALTAPGGSWQSIVFRDYAQTTEDGHNTISIGICREDGTIHLACDHHVSCLHYRKSINDIADKPNDYPGDTTQFTATQAILHHDSVSLVTYPRFVPSPQAGLLLRLVRRRTFSVLPDVSFMAGPYPLMLGE